MQHQAGQHSQHALFIVACAHQPSKQSAPAVASPAAASMAPCRSGAAQQAAWYRHFEIPLSPSRFFALIRLHNNMIASAPEFSETRNQEISILRIGQILTAGHGSPFPVLVISVADSGCVWLASHTGISTFEWTAAGSGGTAVLLCTARSSCSRSCFAALPAQIASGAGGRKLSTMPFSTGPYCSRSAAVQVALSVNSLLYLRDQGRQGRGRVGISQAKRCRWHGG